MSTPRVPAERDAERPAAPTAATTVLDERAGARTADDDRDTVAYPTAAPGTSAPAGARRDLDGRPADSRSVDAASADAAPVDEDDAALRGAAARRVVVGRQREAFGGVKIGSALFGWLAATGTAAILTGAVAGVGAVVGFDTPDRALVLTGVASESLGWIAVAVLAVILLVSYWCGGYVAARMARFNGAVQGLAVWVWALVIAIVVSLVSVIIGSQVDVLSNADLYPRLRMSAEEFTVAGLITSAVVLVSSLAGAVLGGMAGTRYHRRVDRAGFADQA
ncbi:YrzE family protein [Agromyces salentinus]|uniref:Major facilitator superfamily (MFS) profile domain-containing protein n=1 Tax=Agromyces salentinus TaxID=269421 RepID=A0ABN2MMU9_9MICO|nr:YrzE family protein [Agromyces salentinus]